MGVRVLFEDHGVENYNVGLTSALGALGCEVTRFRLRPAYFRVLRTSPDLIGAAAAARDYDVVHLNIHMDATVVLSLAGFPLVVTQHGPSDLERARGGERVYAYARATSLKVASALGNQLATISRYAADSISSAVGVRPAVVYHGIGPEWFRRVAPSATARTALRIPQGKRVALWVGRGTEYKDPMTLLRAIRRVHSVNQNVFFVVKLWHSMPMDAEIESFVVRNGLASSVLIIHDMQPELIPYLYAAADMLVHTSREEGFGFAVLEAMASALPVVVSDRGGPSEFVGAGGIQFRAGDDSELADIVLSLSEDEVRRNELGRVAAEVAHTMTWDRAARAYMALYRNRIDSR